METEAKQSLLSIGNRNKPQALSRIRESNNPKVDTIQEKTVLITLRRDKMLIEGGIKLSEQLTNSAPMLPERPRNELQITDQKSVSVDDIADEEDDTVEQKIKGVGNGHFSNELNDRSMHSKTNSYGAAPAHIESSQTN